MNKKRLLKLADFLDSLSKQKFDFGCVANQYGKPMKEALKAGKHACGTVACAIGWTPAVFPRLVKWVNEWTYGDDIKNATELTVQVKESGANSYIRVGEELFDLTWYESYNLFTPGVLDAGENATPKQVAKQIRKFVKDKEKALEREALEQESEQFATV